MSKEKQLNPSEAVFALLGYIGSLKKPIKIGAGCDSMILAEIGSHFCEAQGLPSTRKGWENLVKPMKDEPWKRKPENG